MNSGSVVVSDGEASEPSRGGGVRLRSRNCVAVARTLPVSEFFFTQLGPGRFAINATNTFADEVVLSRMHVRPPSAGTVVPDSTAF